MARFTFFSRGSVSHVKELQLTLKYKRRKRIDRTAPSFLPYNLYKRSKNSIREKIRFSIELLDDSRKIPEESDLARTITVRSFERVKACRLEHSSRANETRRCRMSVVPGRSVTLFADLFSRCVLPRVASCVFRCPLAPPPTGLHSAENPSPPTSTACH